MKLWKQSDRKKGSNERGMTLLEIMLVLAILSGLIAILATQVQGRLRRAKVNQAKIQMGEIVKALETYNLDCGNYPTTDEGLTALTQATSSCPSWGPEPYWKRISKDPWNNDYIYESSGNQFTLMTLGADRREGGKDDAADITNDDL